METIYHLFDVPATNKEALHEALTSVKGLSEWWTTKTESLGKQTLRFHFGGGYFKEFTIEKESPEKVVWKCIKGNPEWLDTMISFEMQEDGDKVTVHFRHSKWKEQSSMYGICNYHWALYMKSLKDLVETGKGNPTKVEK